MGQTVFCVKAAARSPRISGLEDTGVIATACRLQGG